ncbi:ComEC/Rec2 family competence protein [Haloimpatiens sp. FM7330]|uniref:ComEC/Rec2 family competence protein n=1 Tax=Haloimpatiens sp. FM7330 TaxID=3298610 RepID=UPI00364509F7
MFDRPLVYYVFFLILGCISCLISNKSFYCALISVLVIMIIFFFTLEDKKFFIINVLFLILGILCFNLYFNMSIPSNMEVRITDKKNYYCYASYKGRKVLLYGNVKNLKNGMKVLLEGTFKSTKNYEKGLIGTYTVKQYEIKKRDLIYMLYQIKEKLYEKYCERVGSKKTSLIMALCYGEPKYLKYGVKKEFQKLGVIHALCVSGFHISIVYKLFSIFAASKLAFIFTLVYVIFTGAKASAVRAYIMILIYKCSKKVFRNYDAISSLSLAAIILIMIKPYYILDIGFNLSFLSTLGIILYNKKISRYLYKLPCFLNKSISIALSAQVFSVPYAALSINNISLGFLLGNLILVPIYSLIIILGNIAIIAMPLKFLFNGICYILYSVLTAAEGGNYLLLKICPPVINTNYFYGLALLTLYMEFIMLKHYIKESDKL